MSVVTNSLKEKEGVICKNSLSAVFGIYNVGIYIKKITEGSQELCFSRYIDKFIDTQAHKELVYAL